MNGYFPGTEEYSFTQRLVYFFVSRFIAVADIIRDSYGRSDV